MFSRARRNDATPAPRPRRFLQRMRAQLGRSAILPASVDAVVESPGSALEPDVRAAMEERLGRDFSRVRIHTDSAAAGSARSVDALAYTVGEHVAFDSGRYAPHTDAGRRLLAHALTHVGQQREGLLRQPAGAEPAEDEPEREARAAEEPPVEEATLESLFPDEPIPGGAIADPEPILLAQLDDAGVGPSPDVASPGEGAKATGSGAAASLKPPEKRIVVDLGKQQATALEDGKPVRTMPVSSGKAGHATTPGSFTIYDVDKNHKSTTYGKCVSKGGSHDATKGAGSCKKGEKYEGAPMPFFQRFNGAQGLHQGKLPGYPDSHGCVRLEKKNAEWLWNWAGKGTKVDVIAPAKKKAPATAKKKK